MHCFASDCLGSVTVVNFAFAAQCIRVGTSICAVGRTLTNCRTRVAELQDVLVFVHSASPNFAQRADATYCNMERIAVSRTAYY